jgi:hypothetical protein
MYCAEELINRGNTKCPLCLKNFEVKFKPTLDKVTQECIRNLNDEKFVNRKLEMIEENEWKEYRKVIYFEFGNTY